MTKTNRDSVEAFIQSALMEPIMSERLLRTSEDIDDIYTTVDLLRALLTRAEQAEAKLAILDDDQSLTVAYLQGAKDGKADVWGEAIGAAAKSVNGLRDLNAEHHNRAYAQGHESACIGLAGVIRATPNPYRSKADDAEE